MNENKQLLVDAQNLKKYPEFYALKQTMEAFCDSMDDISDVDITNLSRVTLVEEVYGRRYASKKVREMLSTLGLVDKTKAKVLDKTGE